LCEVGASKIANPNSRERERERMGKEEGPEMGGAKR
jgi:hypothetical protein